MQEVVPRVRYAALRDAAVVAGGCPVASGHATALSRSDAALPWSVRPDNM